MSSPYQFRHAGDTGLVVGLADTPALVHRQPQFDTASIRGLLRALAHTLKQEAEDGKIDGLVDMIPGMVSLVLCYDPLLISAKQLKTHVERHPPDTLAPLVSKSAGVSRTIAMPCCYEGEEFAPDLIASATALGMTPHEVIASHTNHPLEVAMMGFLPGLAYMTGVEAKLSLPRRATHRQHVPAGSVGIVKQQTVIYPLPSPGGWNLIGRVPLVLFDPKRDDPILLRPGDQVQFHAISRKEYDRLHVNQHNTHIKNIK